MLLVYLAVRFANAAEETVELLTTAWRDKAYVLSLGFLKSGVIAPLYKDVPTIAMQIGAECCEPFFVNTGTLVHNRGRPTSRQTSSDYLKTRSYVEVADISRRRYG